MKTIAKILVVFTVVAVAWSCNKNNAGSDNAGVATLTGKWKLSQVLNDPGNGSGTWMPVTSNNYVVFEANGKLSGTAYPDYTTYSIKDSIDVTFYKADKTLQYYRYKLHDGVLDMSPDGPIRCFERCESRFVKVNEVSD